MQKSFALILFSLLFCLKIDAQEDTKFIDLSKTTKFIDTMFIDRDLNNWSVRAFSSFKEQRFDVDSDGNKYLYTPNNPYGVGFGVGTKKLILDFSFNIKASEVNPTERFDLSWSFFQKKHLFDFYFQNYIGFEILNENTDKTIFREDVRSLSSAFAYMYMFHEPEYSIASMKTGLISAKRSSFSFGLGGFLLYNKQNGNGSILPVEDTNSEDINNQIDEFKGTGIGMIVGFSTLIVLPKNFFVSINATPGVGIMRKYVASEDSGYHPKNPLVTQLGLSVLLGYDAKQYYLNLSLSNGYYATDYNFDNQVLFGYLNAKLVFGYKLKGKIKRNWKK